MPFTYKKYLNKLPFAVFVCDKKLKVAYYNEFFAKTFEPGSKRALIGKVIGCSENTDNCGKNANCKYCQLRKSLEEAVGSKLPSFTRRVLKNIGRDGGKIYFTMTVKKIGRRYMALIEDSLEMNLYNELMAARSLQQKMLPQSDEACGKKYAYYYRPGGEISGDLLDVFQADSLACGFVADVSGRGIGAAMLSSFIKTAYERTKPLLSQAITSINEKYRALKTDEREYITLLAVAIDGQNNKFQYTAAGHSVPLFFKYSGKVKELSVTSPPISNWFENFVYTDFEQKFKKDDILALITDGITEAKNEKGERFGVKRVKTVLLQSSCADDFCRKLEKAINVFAPQANDDISALAFDL